MKNILKLLFVLILSSSLTTTEVQASHYAAIDMYYEYLGPLNYRIHLLVYRRCNPGASTIFGGTMWAQDSTCGQTYINIPFDTVGANDPLNGTIQHSLCQNVVPNPCAQSLFPAYEYRHFVGNVTLPYVCAYWRFWWDDCCRPNTDNIQGQPGMSVYADLNNTVRPNNSVQLTAPPIPYICQGQAWQYLNSPLDPDLDSIVFTVTSALDWNPTANYTPIAVPYDPGYSALSPLPTNGPPPTVNPAGYVIDPSTGTVAFTSTLVGQFVLAFTATEYDYVTQQKVGAITRDVIVNVVGCTTTPPTPASSPSLVSNLSGAILISNASPVVLGVCPGETMSFQVSAKGDTLNNLVKTYANNAISAVGSTYTSNPLAGGNPVVGTFTWTPPASQIGAHTVIITFVDSTCTNGQPIILKSNIVVLIKVLRGVSAGPDLPVCLKGDSIIIPALGPEDITQWTWSELGNTGAPHGMSNPNVQNPFVRPDRTTTYIVSTNGQTACKNRDTITVYIDTSVTVQGAASPATLCEPGITNLTATPLGPPPSYSCGDENVGCAAPSAAATFGFGSAATFNVTPFLGSSNGARCQLVYTQTELAAAGQTGPRRIDSLSFDVINKTSFGSYNLEIKMGCTYITDINSFLPSGLLKKVYENSAYQTTLGNNTFKFQTPFIWDGASSIVIDVCFYNLNPIGIDEVASSSTAPNNKYIGATSPFGGCQIPEAPGSSLPTISTNRPNIRLFACDLPATAWQYRWEGPYIFDATVQNAQAFVNDNITKYVVYTTGGNGCEVWDTVTVVLSSHDVTVVPVEKTICLNDRVRVMATGLGSSPTETFQWFAGSNSLITDLSCATCNTPEIVPTTAGVHTYTVVRTDFFGCTDTATTVINVLDLPVITITNGDTIVVRYGESVQLVAEGGVKYSWTPSWGMNNPNIASPVIRPSESALYTVHGIDNKPCGNKDAIYVKVDFSHNLFIPTAFSPNGDGNNDVFRIANMGSQSVAEFRVFNRWGQEVFYARDNNGWNGTYRGGDQDNGTYHYIIKAAFADGHVETFKGEVVLLR